jgi:hexosaminidase
MIDSSRHFLPLEVVYQTLDGMVFNKMNVLHWHLTDDDSFSF